MDWLSQVNFTVFSTLFKTATNFTNFLVAIEKSYETGTPRTGSLNSYDNRHIALRAFMADNVVVDFIMTRFQNNSAISFLYDSVGLFSLFLIICYIVLMPLIGIFLCIRALFSFRFVVLALFGSEQEFATPRMISLLASVFTCLVFTSVFPALLGFKVSISLMFYSSFLFLIFLTTVILPLNLMYNWGSYFSVFIKGQSIKKDIFFEWLTDYIHVLSFFLRINIQLIRLVIITLVFYAYNTLYIELLHPTIGNSTGGSGSFYEFYASVLHFIQVCANFLYEIGHLWVVVGMQSGAFAIIVFVITQFLYSVYLVRRLSIFLNKHKRL